MNKHKQNEGIVNNGWKKYCIIIRIHNNQNGDRVNNG